VVDGGDVRNGEDEQSGRTFRREREEKKGFCKLVKPKY